MTQEENFTCGESKTSKNIKSQQSHRYLKSSASRLKTSSQCSSEYKGFSDFDKAVLCCLCRHINDC